ncbi:mediator of RNA polymerase II transcription subunit 21-like isoform X2 [Rhododendron vialii]|uniref:mediator of RNA polymerase II transcription subunit 21-like isoform X2 n=1 Tax=Rhododendron vialii TaxID=182163 RepID=UPI00265F2C28|nr:mediator of RNA polymerase II transcription subunit 21-like isoform X2 [Rhododendron vialii]
MFWLSPSLLFHFSSVPCTSGTCLLVPFCRSCISTYRMLVFHIQFDALVAALPSSEGGEEAQLKRIAELQAENDAVGQELQRQLEAADEELKQVQELFSQAADNCLNLKKPE